jgi:hypothetical protein
LAIDQPRKMKVIPAALPGGSSTTVAAAWGVNTPAERIVTTRTASSMSKFRLSADSACPATYSSSEPTSSRRRSTSLVTAAISGAPAPMTMAPAQIRLPPLDTDTPSSRTRSFIIPAGNSTPVPMTKLPANSAQRARRPDRTDRAGIES